MRESRALALGIFRSGKTTGIDCIKVTIKTRGKKEETIFFILTCCMAASPDKSLEGAFTYYLGSN
jgi:predicted AAA+ superfamily ATPase